MRVFEFPRSFEGHVEDDRKSFIILSDMDRYDVVITVDFRSFEICVMPRGQF